MSPFDQQNDSTITSAVLRVQSGDRVAFETIVRKFEHPIRAWFAVQTPPGVDVDEIAQRTFVAAFTGIREFEPGSDIRAWLYAIARYQLKTEITRLRRVADYHTRYAPELLLRELEKQADQNTEDRIEHLKSCIESLGEHLRRFVGWRYEEEIPLEEMAARCDRSVTAVKKQLWKIRRRLQECVERRLATEGEPS